MKRALAAPYSSHFSASHLFQSAVKKMAGGKGGWGEWGEGGKMPGNSQPMQCGNSSMNCKDLKKKEKLSRNGRLLKVWVFGAALATMPDKNNCKGLAKNPSAAVLTNVTGSDELRCGTRNFRAMGG